ncbi:tRNA (guanosine(37)-N1)-methyltransferase TrmD [bacterium]|nr:tRNA (guanosine(37)-N1)-methyltransferase TrmD [bacterium]
MTVNILTLFPELVEIAFTQSILKRARMKGLFEPRVINIRDFSRDKHRTADDKPYGGGCGMVIKIEPIARALAAARRRGGTGKIFLLTPTGRKFDQAMARKLSQESQFTLICGRYEGIDQRVEDNFCDEAISIGDYVLTGGEPVAVVIIDAVVRLLPNVLGAKDSAVWDSFSDGLLDYPHYTRPPSYRNWRVPEVLLSGDHKKLTGWRREKQLETTLWNRPDLLQNASLSVSDLKVLDGLQKKAKKKQKTSRRIKS